MLDENLKEEIEKKQGRLGKLWVDGNTLKWALITGEIKQLELNATNTKIKWKKVNDRMISKREMHVF